MVSDGEPSMGWGIEIKGHQFDLDDWAIQFASRSNPEDVYVERIRIGERDGVTVLRSNDLDACSTDADAHTFGKLLHRQCDAIMQVIVGAEPTEIDGVISFVEGLPPSKFVFSEAHARGRARATASAVVLHADGTTDADQRPRRSAAQKAARLCARESKERLQDATIHFGRSQSDDWYDLFKAFEALGSFAGSLLDRGWTSAEDDERFRKTCHYHRHYQNALPTRPMSFREAREYVQKLLLKALEHPWK
jgi:hypothetical protein